MRYVHKIVKVYHCLYFVSGPQSIGARTNDEPLEAGVFVSDGIYIRLLLLALIPT